MQVLMQTRYTPYYKPLKISIPEPAYSIDPRVPQRFDYLPYYCFGNYFNNFSVPPSLPVANAANRQSQKDELKFSIDSILGLNKRNYSNETGIVNSTENNPPEIGTLSSEVSTNQFSESSRSSPTSSTSRYSPEYYVERTAEPEISRSVSSPESSESVSSCTNKRNNLALPVDLESGKSKRVRTIFSADQMARLEQEFSRSQYMVGQERTYLAQILNLSESQVKIWFQNRRIKYRKQHLERQRTKLAEEKVSKDSLV